MIQVLERTLEIIEFLARQNESPTGLGKVATATRIHPATCARILQTMANRGYIEQTGPRKGYLLGPMFYRLTEGRGPYRRFLVTAAEPAMRELAAAFGDTCVLGVLSGGRRFTIAEARGEAKVQVRNEVLHVDCPFRTPTGRVLLAHLSPRQLEPIIAGASFPLPDWPEIEDRQSLLDKLSRLRKQETVICEDRDIAAMATPVRQHGEVVAALGFYLPSPRFNSRHRITLVQRLESTARQISGSLQG